MHDQELAGIILAAGKGTRMKSDLPKGLHLVAGIPMVELIGRAMKSAGVAKPIIVVGHGGDNIIQALGDTYDYVWQHEQLGTGHAALMAADILSTHSGPVLVAPGDTPLLDAYTLKKTVESHREAKALCTLATTQLENAFGYGRIVRGATAQPERIVEEKDATDAQRCIKEVCTSIYCFDCETLLRILPTLGNSNSQGEYYLTDVVSQISKEGGTVVGTIFHDPSLVEGVNDRWQLALANQEMMKRILKAHALSGVTLNGIESINIGIDVEIGPDTVIEPGTTLGGKTKIGSACRIGPNTRIVDATIGERSTIQMSHVIEATIGNRVWVGPFANLRPKTVIMDDVKIGNFVEIKNSTLKQGAKTPHLSYIGDSSIGKNSNVGAGTITCNYDGYTKSRTEIGDNVFVGSNSTLVAPLTIGDGAMIAAGSVITQNIPADAGAFGRARQETKEEWAALWRKKKQSTD